MMNTNKQNRVCVGTRILLFNLSSSKLTLNCSHSTKFLANKHFLLKVPMLILWLIGVPSTLKLALNTHSVILQKNGMMGLKMPACSN